jgi:hypothetical protein
MSCTSGKVGQGGKVPEAERQRGKEGGGERGREGGSERERYRDVWQGDKPPPSSARPPLPPPSGTFPATGASKLVCRTAPVIAGVSKLVCRTAPVISG